MIIGLIGAPKVGKDLIADYFVKYHNFKKFAFADKIKDEFFSQNKYSNEDFNNAKGTYLEETIRSELWNYSNEACKEKGSLYFIEKVINNLEKNSIVSDIRTELEKDKIEEKSGKIVLIFREYINKFLLGNVYPDDLFIGTKIRNKCLLNKGYKIFKNIFQTKEELYKELSNLYLEIN